MNRPKLAAATAALILTIAGCGTAGDDADISATTPDSTQDESPVAGDLTATITDAEVADDGSVTLTVETGDGTEELTTSTAAYITAPSAAGGQQRTRLTTWLENNEFDGGTTYELRQRDGVVTQIRG
ncbi:MAG: hypothetical protein WD010_03435 [Nitriliruptor sp.]|uniref:hypothetical protein n=1 Tax=Nitriliruptor sp. TaxID=2448056 RepID=UPI0034A00413